MLERIISWTCWICGGTAMLMIVVDVLCFSVNEGFPDYKRMHWVAGLLLIALVGLAALMML